MTKTANSKLGVDKKNENSPKGCREYIAPNNHSTPVRQKPSTDNTEDLSNLDYSPNPILLPCTQEGSNEVAWDWENALKRTPKGKGNKQIIQSETPKGTKPFQRKRNSDSPLLSKPFKRKSIKMESIEHIGQFAAELQALSEKVRTIRQNDSEDSIKEEPITIEMSNNEEDKSSIADNKENHAAETNIVTKRSASYDDLFDDSIDDSMARCTQEIEEKLNLIVKENSIVHSQVDIKDKKLSPTDNTAAQASTIQSKKSSVTASSKSLFHGDTNGDSTSRTYSKPIAAKESSTVYSQEDVKKEKLSPTNNTATQVSTIQPKESSVATSSKNWFCKGANNDGTLKTYSKLSFRRDANPNVLASIRKDQGLHKLCLNNNIVHRDTEKSHNDKKSSKDSVAELFHFPDDSFDDCLATCIEDDELMPLSAKSSSFLVPKFDSSYKNLTHAPLKGKPLHNNTAKEKIDTPTTGSLDNRKFFKSKSLSDQYIGQNCKSTTHIALPLNPAKSVSSSASKSISTVSHDKRVACTSVSTNSTPTNDRHKIENSAISSISSANNRTLSSDVNRTKEGVNRFVKYNSTGNMRNDAKESTKSGSLAVRCTAEEIEKKRLQAKMRLEARRKLYVMNVKNNINR